MRVVGSLAAGSLCAAMAGCSGPGGGSSSPTPSPTDGLFSATAVRTRGAWGFDGAIRSYTFDETGNDVVQDPFLEILLLSTDQAQSCMLLIEGTATNTWSVNPIPVINASNTQGVPYSAVSFEFDMSRATVTNVDCAGRLDPAIWTSNPEEAIKLTTWGMAFHDALSNSGQTNVFDSLMTQIVDEFDQSEWDVNWAPNVVGASVTVGTNGPFADAWAGRVGTVDGGFKLDGGYVAAASVSGSDNGVYLLTTPFVINFGDSEQNLADALMGAGAALTAYPVPYLGAEPVDFQPYPANRLP